jgi:hypothetical protein
VEGVHVDAVDIGPFFAIDLILMKLAFINSAVSGSSKPYAP